LFFKIGSLLAELSENKIDDLSKTQLEINRINNYAKHLLYTSHHYTWKLELKQERPAKKLQIEQQRLQALLSHHRIVK